MEENKIIENDNVGHIVTADELTMDEATIIREQERLTQEKKRKASAKRKRVILIIFAALIAAVVWYLGWGRTLFFKDEEVTVAIAANENQTIKYAKINSIYGNEINITYLSELEKQETEEDSIPTDNEEEKSSEIPDGFGTQNSQGRPDFSNSNNGEVPERPGNGTTEGGNGSFKPESGDFGKGNSKWGDVSENSKVNRTQRNTVALSYMEKEYSLSDETEITQIPVGVVVTTQLGTETTFSRIYAGDYVAIVTEMINGKEEIIALYIIG